MRGGCVLVGGATLCASRCRDVLDRRANAQTRFTYSSGQVVSPAYEGWMTERRRLVDDGSSAT